MNASSGYTYVQVEANENTPMSASQVYKNITEPFRVAMVRLYEGEPGGALYEIAGWSSRDGGTPTDAFAVQVEDSSAGAAYVVYGGDLGVRLRPAGSGAPWDVNDAGQVGETHLVLADLDDIVAAKT